MYTYERFAEALSVIRNDNAARNLSEREKIETSQYRDGFDFRQATAVHAQSMYISQNQDISDDEYCPPARRTRRKKHKTDVDDDYKENSGRRRKARTKRKRKVTERPVEATPTTPDIKNMGDDDADNNDVDADGCTQKRRRLDEDDALNGYLGLSDEHTNSKEQPEQPQVMEDDGVMVASGQFTLSDEEMSSVPCREEIRNTDESLFQDEHMFDPRQPAAIEVSKIKAINHNTLNLSTTKSDHTYGCTGSIESQSSSIHTSPTNDNDDMHSLSLTPDSTPTSTPKGAGNSWLDAISISSSSTPASRATTPEPPSRMLLMKPQNDFSGSPGVMSDRPSLQQRKSSSARLTINTTVKMEPKRMSNIITMTTFFAHPIDFKSTNPQTCTFHNDYRHPILGHGQITGRYGFETPLKPSQITEMSNGHLHHNPSLHPDKMCVECSLSYLQIIRCEKHTLQKIPHNPRRIKYLLEDGGNAYINDLFTQLPHGHAERNTKPLIETCHLCPAPAEHKCRGAQVQDRQLQWCRMPNESVIDAQLRIHYQYFHNPAGQQQQQYQSSFPTMAQLSTIQIQEPIHGCGLLLCSVCADFLANRCDGQLQENKALMLANVVAVGRGTRADVEFLFKGGLVWKAYFVDQ